VVVEGSGGGVDLMPPGCQGQGQMLLDWSELVAWDNTHPSTFHISTSGCCPCPRVSHSLALSHSLTLTHFHTCPQVDKLDLGPDPEPEPTPAAAAAPADAGASKQQHKPAPEAKGLPKLERKPKEKAAAAAAQ